jgi:RND family efflux transporter MFP subunit
MLSAVLLSGCGDNNTVDKNDTHNIIRPAKLLKLDQTTHDNLLNYPAVIEVSQQSQLAFQVSGKVEKLLVRDSDDVKKGDVIAQIGKLDYQSKLNMAKAQFDNASAEYDRAKKLIGTNVISRSEFAKKKTEFEVTSSQMVTAQKALDDTTLRAPFTGNIANVLIEPQETVQAGVTVVTILSLDKLEAKINIPSNIILRAPKNPSQEPKAFIVLDAEPNLKINAKFKELNLEADLNSQTYQVVFSFDAISNLNILPGMSATLWLAPPVSTKQSANIEIPLTAIGLQDDSTFVWVVNEKTMQVSKRDVVLKPGIGETLEVISGLSANETIVAAGISALADGNIVRAWVKK